MDLKKLIAQERAKAEGPQPTVTKTIPLGESGADVTFEKLRGDAWQALVAEYPAREDVVSDFTIGYNERAVTLNYPLEHVTVDGEPVDVETWAELYEVLDGVGRNLLALGIWQVNVQDAINRLAELGKARAALLQTSPGNRASRRAASKGGSRQK
uniref:hypothetical protein n=1 Tax=Microbacterium proteolyticum TaxID=1572644 RepID=UPI002417F776|nr:hypothetical protein [Microbacterium proteolyticum]